MNAEQLLLSIVAAMYIPFLFLTSVYTASLLVGVAKVRSERLPISEGSAQRTAGEDAGERRCLGVVIPLYREDVHSIAATVKSILRQRSGVSLRLYFVLEEEDLETRQALIDALQRLGIAEKELQFEVIVRSGGRSSKAAAINYSLQSVSEDYILFLDSAIELGSATLIEDIVKLLKRYDVVFMPVEMGRGQGLTDTIALIDTAGWFEHVLPLIWLSTGYPVVNGGCFAARKALLLKILPLPEDVLTEDAYMRILFYKHRPSVAMLRSCCVKSPPRSIIEFAKQRLRWYRGYYQCIIHSFRLLGPRRGLKASIPFLTPLVNASQLLSAIFIILSIALHVLGSPMDAFMKLVLLAALTHMFATFVTGVYGSYTVLSKRMARSLALAYSLLYPLLMLAEGALALGALAAPRIGWYRTRRSYVMR